MKFGRFLIVGIMILFTQKAFVQVGKNSNTDKSPVTYVFVSQWGPLKSGNHSAAQVSAVAPAAILVKDQIGNVYTVLSFRINYKFISTYKDEQTEQVKSMMDLRVGDFSSTSQLSKPWIESIKDNIKTGDTILINKIIFKNKLNKTQLAPDLRIAVQ